MKLTWHKATGLWLYRRIRITEITPHLSELVKRYTLNEIRLGKFGVLWESKR